MIPLNNIAEVLNFLPYPTIIVAPENIDFTVLSRNDAYNKLVPEKPVSNSLHHNLPLDDQSFSSRLYHLVKEVYEKGELSSFTFHTPGADHEISALKKDEVIIITFNYHPQRAEDELLKKEHQYNILNQQSTDLISIITADFKPLYRGPSNSNFTGWSDEEMKNLSITKLLPQEDLVTLEEAVKMSVAYPKTAVPVSFRMLHKKGHYIWLEGSITNYLSDELIKGLVLNVRDVSEARESERWMKRHQRELKQAQQVARMGYIHFDLVGNDSFGSDEMFRIWETDKDHFELNLERFLQTIHPDDKKRFEEFLLKLFAGFSDHEIEYRIKLSSGVVKHIFQRTELEKDNKGQVIALNGILLNISERRQTETALLESDEKFRKLFNSSPLPQWLFDSDTLYFIDVNDAAIKNYGYTRDEFLSMTIEDIRPQQDVARLLETREKIKQMNNDFKDRTFIHRKKNGEYINVDIKSAHVIINGKNARVVIARDITAELAFEKQLIESNERYNLVLEATNESIIDWDIVNDKTIWGKGFQKNFGYDLSKYDNHLWSRHIHDDDRRRVLTDLEKTLEDPSKRYFDAEFAYVKADGNIAYVQHRGIILRNRFGQPIRAIGAMIDVTELKEKISEIEKHNENLRNIAWTQSHIVRAPLARLIGLIKLIENKDVATIDFEELSKILTYIVSSAYELDNIIRDIVKKTETLKP